MEPLRVSRHPALGRVAWFRCERGYELSGMAVRRDHNGAGWGWAGTTRVFVPRKMTSPGTLKAVLGSVRRF
jgi:hypothetical protein